MSKINLRNVNNILRKQLYSQKQLSAVTSVCYQQQVKRQQELHISSNIQQNLDFSRIPNNPPLILNLTTLSSRFLIDLVRRTRGLPSNFSSKNKRIQISIIGTASKRWSLQQHLTIGTSKQISFRLFSSHPGVLTPVRGESLKIMEMSLYQ